MNSPASRLANQFQIPYAYDVCFGRDVFACAGRLLVTEVARVFATNLPVPTLVFLDEGLAQAQPDLNSQIVEYLAAHPETFAPRPLSRHVARRRSRQKRNAGLPGRS